MIKSKLSMIWIKSNRDPCAPEKSRTVGTRSTESELASFFQNLSVGGTKPAIYQ